MGGGWEQAVPAHADSLAILHSHRSCALNGTAEDGVGSQPGVAQALIRGCGGAKDPPGTPRGASEQTEPCGQRAPSPLLPESPRFKEKITTKLLVIIREESRNLFQFMLPGAALQANRLVSPGEGRAPGAAPHGRGLCASPAGVPMPGTRPAASRPCQPARPAGKGGLRAARAVAEDGCRRGEPRENGCRRDRSAEWLHGGCGAAEGRAELRAEAGASDLPSARLGLSGTR